MQNLTNLSLQFFTEVTNIDAFVIIIVFHFQQKINCYKVWNQNPFEDITRHEFSQGEKVHFN